MTHRLLIVEDEPELRQGLVLNLEAEGYRVDAVGTGEEAIEHLRRQEHDLVLLDLMLPGASGHDVLRTLRDEHVRLPVIVISAKDRPRDKVVSLDFGADDYVTKPFGLEELSARVRAVLRRTNEPPTAARSIYRFPNLEIDFERQSVHRDGEDHGLSPYESQILRELIIRRGQIVSRRDLLGKIWGYAKPPATRTVDNHVARLRKKIESDPDQPVHLHTVHGHGYRFESEELR
ncbi:MAG: response regulator transcription factor [Planctomycetota bacterium]